MSRNCSSVALTPEHLKRMNAPKQPLAKLSVISKVDCNKFLESLSRVFFENLWKFELKKDKAKHCKGILWVVKRGARVRTGVCVTAATRTNSRKSTRKASRIFKNAF